MSEVSAYPTPITLVAPLSPYDTGDYHRFGSKVSGWLGRAIHLGDDLVAQAHTPVKAIGEGHVVWARMHKGSQEKRHWGGLVVIAHTHRFSRKPFFSVYGHLFPLSVEEGQKVEAEQTVGRVAQALSAENGWWIHPHLHFAIYVGPWKGQILPGYKRWREWGRTKLSWWEDPRVFLEKYTTTSSLDEKNPQGILNG